jgi:hypothetical protein
LLLAFASYFPLTVFNSSTHWPTDNTTSGLLDWTAKLLLALASTVMLGSADWHPGYIAWGLEFLVLAGVRGIYM